MKIRIAAAALAALALSACAGNAGNPNGSPYAGEPGGTIAVAPQNMGEVAYDPYGPLPKSNDMQVPGSTTNRPY